MERSVRELGVAAAASLALAVSLTWPAALHLGERAIGHPGDDVWNHLWGYAWVADEVAAGRWPVHTSALRWPDGGSLWFIDAAQALALAPITRHFGAVPAYDISMMLGLAGSMLGAWVLCRRLCGSALAAAIGAVVYGASPHLLAQAHNGISETVCAGWLPLTLWALLRLLERPGLGRAAVLAGLGAICGLTSWYYGLFAAIAGAVLVVTAAWRGGLGRALPWLVGSALAAGLALLPVLLAFRQTLDAPDAVVSRDLDFVAAQLDHHNLTDLLAFVAPGAPSPDLKALFGEDLLIVVYLGWVGLVLAALGLRERRGALAPWVTVGLVFLVFSLGPWLYVGGEHVLVGGRRMPLPFLPLFDAIPLFARISHPFRFAVGVSLAVAVGASCGLERLLRGARWPAGLALGAAGLALVEVAALSPSPLPVATSDATIPEVLRDLPVVDGAVLDLPMALGPLERGWYSWLQTAHDRPVPWGLNEPLPALLAENRLSAILLRIEAGTVSSLPPALPMLELALGARELEALGLAAIVVHERLYPPGKLVAARAVLDALYGPPLRPPEGGVLIYAVAPPQRGE